MARRKGPATEMNPVMVLVLIVVFGLIALFIFRSGAGRSSGGVHVDGYHRSDGTYVAPHERSRPSHP